MPMAGEFEQQVVARYQQIGLAASGKNQELLVVLVTTARQQIVFLSAGVA